MDKVKLNSGSVIYPMPIALVGAVVEGKVNFMPLAWMSRANMHPPMIAVGMGKHYTNIGMQEHNEFSVNIPSMDMLELTDYCGLISGEKQDKSDLFTVFYGELAHAPMIEECPITMTCKLVQTILLPSHKLYIGEIVDIYASAGVLSDGKPDITKIRPFVFTMPDNGYWSLGEHIGQGWSSGKNYVR